MSCNKCSKCNIQKCHAECCTWVPLSENFIHAHEDKVQRPIYGMNILFETKKNTIGQCITNPEMVNDERRKELRSQGVPIKDTDQVYIDKQKQLCPFLTTDYRCAVYHDRPELCKTFGSTNEPDNTYTCHYHLGKDYHFPKEGSEEHKAINTFKYFKRDVLSNKKLLNEVVPDKHIQNKIINHLKLLNMI